MIGAIDTFLMPWRGLSLVFASGLRRYVLLPLLVNILVFALTAWLGAHYFSQFIDWALPRGSWWHYLEWLLWPLFVLAYLLLVFYGFTIVANLIASPFNGILAARVEEKLTGKLPPDAPGGIMAELVPAVTGELGKLLHFLKWAVPVLMLMVIPGVNVVGSGLWLLLGFWFLALQYLDYPMGNHQLWSRQQRAWLRRHPLQAWAFGAGANLLLMIPVINLAAMPASVAGATRWWVKRREKPFTP